MSAKPPRKISRIAWIRLQTTLDVAQQDYAELLKCERQILELLPFPDAHAHVNAAAFGDMKAEELLNRLGVTVEKKK